MKQILVLIAALLLNLPSFASGNETEAWDKAPYRLNDQEALQNGARLFVNYCLNCHSASAMRFNRMNDIGLSDQQIKENLLFGSRRVGDTMQAAFDPKLAKEWFGKAPPDLSVIARSHAGGSRGTGADYLYTYLRTYYRDDTRPTGWNNKAFPNVAMPHALWELQASMKPAEYDKAVGDLVGFMQWMGEPVQNRRIQIGVWALLFLGLVVLITWRLNAAYWKDIK